MNETNCGPYTSDITQKTLDDLRVEYETLDRDSLLLEIQRLTQRIELLTRKYWYLKYDLNGLLTNMSTRLNGLKYQGDDLFPPEARPFS